MQIQEILSKIDHTVLLQTACWEDIRKACDEAVRFSAASVCISQCYVKNAFDYAGGKIKICTVAGFPNGYSTLESKCFEASKAVEAGASEIDMVINIGFVKDSRYDLVLEEIKAVKNACFGKILKVIVETCLLTNEEKIKMCKIVSESGADYIKTSTGFAGGGAVKEDIMLFAENIAPHVKIKAAGGIKTLKAAEDFIALGASRIGSSAIIKSLYK